MQANITVLRAACSLSVCIKIAVRAPPIEPQRASKTVCVRARAGPACHAVWRALSTRRNFAEKQVSARVRDMRRCHTRLCNSRVGGAAFSSSAHSAGVKEGNDL
eukprot:IDg20691t1